MTTFRPLFQRYMELFQGRGSSVFSRRAISVSNSNQLARRAGLSTATTTTAASSCASTFRKSPQSIYRASRQSAFIRRPFSFRGRLPRRGYSTNAKPEEEPHSLSQRLKKLSREYGWSALGVYLLLSALDFPLCFAAVRLLGVDRIGHWEHVIVESVKSAFKSVWPFESEKKEVAGAEEIPGASVDHGVAEAEKKNTEEGASMSSPRFPHIEPFFKC